MLEIYEGDGKGKTTAACGLAVRAAGHGVPVLFAQFLKDGSSGELRMLESLPGIRIMLQDAFFGFLFRMSGEEKEETARSCRRLLDSVREAALPCTAKGAGEEPSVLIVLDEILHVLKHGLIGEEEFLDFLDALPGEAEVVLTGRGPSPVLLERAAYVTEMRCLKHPFSEGVPARPGIEH